MKNQLLDLIVDKLNENKARLHIQFNLNHPIKIARHFTLDDFLPADLANTIYTNFPKPRKMRLLSNFGELKLKYSHIKYTAPLIRDLHFAIQHPKVIAIIEEITGIKNQVPDPSDASGGVSTLLKGYYINPHLDNSHDLKKRLYRTVNVLYYVSPNWGIENGGNYELWDENIQEHLLVPSLFNRLLVMETNQTSWHAVNPVVCEKPRCCVFNYYFSEQSPQDHPYFHTGSALFFNPLFKARPEQMFRRRLAAIRSKILGK